MGEATAALITIGVVVPLVIFLIHLGFRNLTGLIHLGFRNLTGQCSQCPPGR